MPKYAHKQTARVDVLVVGDHPAGFLAAALLKDQSKLRVVHIALGSDPDEDRLVTINPRLFELHPMLSGLARRLPMSAVHGLQFLSDEPQTHSEHRTKSVIVRTGRYSDVLKEMRKLSETAGVETLAPPDFCIHRVDENGLDISVGKHRLNPLVLLTACELPNPQKKILGIPDSWGPDVVHRFTTIRCKNGRHYNANGKQLMPMSLDLLGRLCWGWLLPGEEDFQLLVEQPLEIAAADSGIDLLRHWVKVLQLHDVLGPKFELDASQARQFDRPLTGALAHEGVANRTLLIGPAGGFYSACGEEIYPCCWSALFAVDVIKKALKEKHLQDALNPYRQKWRTTLGDYLRGPHQNLRFLLPLVYRNPTMTARLVEAILLSKSVVR